MPTVKPYLIIALLLTLAAALLLVPPASAQGPVWQYHYWYLSYSTGYGYSLTCHYADRYGHTASWPGRVSAYSGRMYCPGYRVTW
jgi:hypothetical protein